MSLMDQLRQRAEAVRKQQEAARLPEAEARREIEGALWRAFRWLDEAVGHLGVIRPEVAHRFRLADYLTIDQPRFDSGFASFRRYGLGAADGGLEHVEMFYQLTAAEPIVVRVNSMAARVVEEPLRSALLGFASETEHDVKPSGSTQRVSRRAADQGVGRLQAESVTAGNRRHAAQRRSFRIGAARIPACRDRRARAGGSRAFRSGRVEGFPASGAACPRQFAARLTEPVDRESARRVPPSRRQASTGISRSPSRAAAR